MSKGVGGVWERIKSATGRAMQGAAQQLQQRAFVQGLFSVPAPVAHTLLRQYVEQLDEPSMQNLRKTIRGLVIEASLAAWQAPAAAWSDWGSTSEDQIALGIAQIRHQQIERPAAGTSHRYIQGLNLISAFAEQFYQAKQQR